MITWKVSWLRRDIRIMFLVPLLADGSQSLWCSKSSSGSCPCLWAQWNGLWCQTRAKWPIAECAACFIILPVSRCLKSTMIKFTFIFPASRFQVLLLQTDTYSGDCSTMHGWSLKTLLSPEANLLHNSGSRKMTQLSDSGDFGVEETTNHAWKHHDRSLHLLKQGGVTEQNPKSQQEAHWRVSKTRKAPQLLNRYQHSCTWPEDKVTAPAYF